MGIEADPIKHNSKCPAIILAVNRIAKVNGRIIFLMVSIITIKGSKRFGVFKGVKWANIYLLKKIHLYNINVNQKHKDNLKQIDKCLVGVKI